MTQGAKASLAYQLIREEVRVTAGKGDPQKVVVLQEKLKERGVSVAEARKLGAEQAANVYLHGKRNPARS